MIIESNVANHPELVIRNHSQNQKISPQRRRARRGKTKKNIRVVFILKQPMNMTFPK